MRIQVRVLNFSFIYLFIELGSASAAAKGLSYFQKHLKLGCHRDQKDQR